MEQKTVVLENIKKLLDHYAGLLTIMVEGSEIRIIPTFSTPFHKSSDGEWIIGSGPITCPDEQFAMISKFLEKRKGTPGKGTFYVRRYPGMYRVKGENDPIGFTWVRTHRDETFEQAVFHSLLEAVTDFHRYVLIRERSRTYPIGDYLKDMDKFRLNRIITNIGIFGAVSSADLNTDRYKLVVRDCEEE